MTRRRAELGTLKTGEIGDLVRTKISENIIEAAEKKRVGDQLVMANNALKNKPDDSIKFYERGEVSASKVGEGASIEDQAQSEVDYSAVMTAKADKFAVYDAITREAIEDARVDVVDGITEEMGEALANQRDSSILRRLCNDSSVTDEVLTTSPTKLAHSPVLSIDSIDTADYSISYATGSIKTGVSTDVTVDYTFGTASAEVSESKDALKMSDVADAKYNITTKQLTPDKLVVSPRFISLLEQNSDFVSANVYQGELPQGVEGQLYNMDVVVSDNLPNEFISILVDSDRAMPFLPKSDLNLERKDDPNEQVLKLYASERYAVGGQNEANRLLRPDAVAVLGIDHAL